MKQNRGLLIVLSIILFVVLGGSFFWQAWNKFVEDSNNIKIEDESFTTINVLSDNAKVKIMPTTSKTTTIEYTGKKRKNAKFDFDANVTNETLVINFKEKRWNFLRFDLSFSKMELLVKVPEKQYESIQVKNNNGEISAENLVVKEVSFETDNGNIELKHVDAVATSVQSDNGKIYIEQVNGKIIGKTDNGRIMLITENLDRHIDLITDNGRIEIVTETEPTNLKIDVKTDNGKIDVFGKNNELTVFGKGENLMKLRSDNGRINVDKK
ncbi:DUF4097 family beta strand repeat-containing protein [Sporosarcina sp. 6E9]|uniref:DUF4097 family beta strand repeat-containing protein n=1 Tax=Sporosarcina sp. 6E9 TaxID=2819235 RepID=UPI001B31476C|nr:DUF4097 family beta strand repeat-containing protein [Sporosarcina sp. 6E9]